MRYRKMGRTGLVVSELCLGTNMFGGAGDKFWSTLGGLDQTAANKIVARATEGGVNFIDTADSYARGESEQIVGQALKDLNLTRHDIVVCTKTGMKIGESPNSAGASRSKLIASCEASLKRLKTDYIDLYLMHSFDPSTPQEESLRALDDLVRAGKVRYPGCSNFAAWEVAKANGAAECLGTARLDVVEAQYSIGTREAERELIPMAASEGVGVLAWGALLYGALTGKYRKGGTEKLGRLGRGSMSPFLDADKVYAIVDVMRALESEIGATPAEIALAFLLQNKTVTCVLFGATKLDQVDSNLRASGLELSAEAMAKLNAVSALPPEFGRDTVAPAREARKALL